MKYFNQLLTVLSFLFISARAVSQINSTRQIQQGLFESGIPTISFYQVALWGQQRCPEWCWAACSQMVLNYYGLYVSQEQIVQRIYGQLVCQPGTDQQILTALSGWAPNASGGTSTIYSQDGLIYPADIINNLAYYHPLIVAIRNPDGSGHAMVLTDIIYTYDAYGNPIPYSVKLRDPWPYNPSLQEWSWQNFAGRVRNIFRVWVQ